LSCSELDIPFLQIAGPEIVSGMSGESEQKIRSLFAEAIAMVSDNKTKSLSYFYLPQQ
jgi:SpoVK/Ycf46/Vps4 family AAA+-type ATPase